MAQTKDINEIISHLKVQGFVFQGSQIYGGLANTWDYGHLGVLLKQNIYNEWKKFYVLSEPNNYLLDSKILMHKDVWVTSGHVSNFNDPLIENKINNKRYRADKLIGEFDDKINAEAMSETEMFNWIKTHIKEYDGSKCEWLPIRKFNLMFETKQGVVEDKKSLVYLRPETAQGIFINFKNMLRATRSKLPMGIAQLGKSFRNEVTPGNFIFRTREFEQLELEVFCEKADAKQIFKKYLDKSVAFLKYLGVNEKNFRLRAHAKEELAHYSLGTTDIEYNFPFGWGELLGVANRSDFDLSSHMKATGEDLTYLNEQNQKITPFVIEPSMGLDRLMLAIICDAFEKEQANDDRIVLKFNKKLAPYRVAVLPLVKKQAQESQAIYDLLAKNDISVTYDETGSIGKRYRRQDAIGTYYCITIDYDTKDDNCVTIRERDSMKQERIAIKDILQYIK
ncbi:Glycine--tRNA ligase [Mycoplasmopsis californica]|uniref:glycine--tRNA ligase n=1 Tax=Mycoplasmopsis equigenitalium TaxID=114883 RepID=A0ABY5J1Q1_9BACT|nr:glycine--tRNA ligase [Mycoplasmopsis equigenitalium]UUD37175.1 glycine--tRNA ligase [Mycoplasmopsis equigenitalium]VEU69519.1 Glycine--tRNA ligase [Mycoplasmopsis californica]